MRRLLIVSTLTALLSATAATLAVANTSHEGWPKIDGRLIMHKADQSGRIDGTAKSDELLGGHGNDTIYGRGAADVLWGDYKPGGQPETQVDRLYGGAGNDFIYASHGENFIYGGAGNDVIHAHFGHGVINCGAGRDTLFISHKARKVYKISNCETISFKTNGS